MLYSVDQEHHYTSPASLSRSIALVTAAALAANIVLIVVFSVLGELAAGQIMGAVAGSIFIHVVLLLGLFYKRDDFRVTETGRHLERVNVANVLTILRISAVPTLLFFVIHGRRRLFAWASIVLAAVVFLTDLFDGLVSRHAHQRTVIGIYLDSAGDYAILAASAVALRVYGLIPTWFFVFVAGRLSLQVVFVVVEAIVIGFARRGTNLIGKASVFATMTAFALALANTVMELTILQTITLYVEYLTAGVLGISAIDKIRLFVSRLFEHQRHSFQPE